LSDSLTRRFSPSSMMGSGLPACRRGISGMIRFLTWSCLSASCHICRIRTFIVCRRGTNMSNEPRARQARLNPLRVLPGVSPRRAVLITLLNAALATTAFAQTDPAVQKLAEEIRQLQAKVAELEQRIASAGASHPENSGATDRATSASQE